jgi:uncharacterized protein YgiM (DUF1202 family)
MKTRFIIPILMLLVLVTCKKTENSPAMTTTSTTTTLAREYTFYVSASAGLRMRAEANLSSTIITTIPDGSKVTVFEDDSSAMTVANRVGRWVPMEYDGKSGYVFSAFLASNISETIDSEKQLTGLWYAKDYMIELNDDGTYSITVMDPSGINESGSYTLHVGNRSIKRTRRAKPIPSP